MDVARMSKITELVTLGVSEDDACETDEERTFYRKVSRFNERAKARGYGLRPVNEFPDVVSPTPAE